MKLHRLPFFLLLSLPALFAADEASAPTTAAGYWSGSIALPTQELGIGVELAPAGDGAWRGTIDIPMQGLRGFKLDPVKVDEATVEFAMPGIPGDPYFKGTLAADGKTISGDFTQGGGRLSFRLERKPKPAGVARVTVPERGAPGQGLTGEWRGAIAPVPNVELRLGLELAADADGKIGGVLVSFDQGNARIPISDLTETDGKVRFDVPRVDGRFTGQLSADGAEIAGEWSQRGGSTPLIFKRLPPAGDK